MLLDLSNLLMDNGQSRAAIACLKRMTTVDPKNISGWQNLAVAQFTRGQYQAGIESSEEALKRDPENLVTLYNLALAHENAGNYAEALRWVACGLNLEPRDLTFQKLEFRLKVMSGLQKVRRTATRLIFWSGR
jgi:tetratricopeptide (TPR) repeat protein